MKKFTLVLSIVIFILWVQPNRITANEKELDYKLIYDSLLTVLDQNIAKEVIDYYGYYKQYRLYDAKIISIKRESEGGFSFRIVVQITTFEHAHNPPYGIDTITFDVSPFGIKTINFVHKGDEEEKKIAEFYNEALSDIKQSFNLRLESFTKYSYEQILYKAEIQNEYKGLSTISEEIIMNILNPTFKPPYKNVIDPITFIKGNKAFVLFKKADGTNVVYEVVRQNDKWVVVKENSKQGKKMNNELIWYM